MMFKMIVSSMAKHFYLQPITQKVTEFKISFVKVPKQFHLRIVAKKAHAQSEAPVEQLDEQQLARFSIGSSSPIQIRHLMILYGSECGKYQSIEYCNIEPSLRSYVLFKPILAGPAKIGLKRT